MPKTPIDIYSLTDATSELETDVTTASITGSLREIRDRLELAREVQWESPHPPLRPVSGQPLRPVEDTALDPVRLRLRTQVIAAERSLAEVALYLHMASQSLQEALEEYYTA